MGILFSRGPAIEERSVLRLCQQITAEGKGAIGLSSILSPNTHLLLGQGSTVQQFIKTMHTLLPAQAQMRINDQRWPPMHTPIVRQRQIPDRASMLMDKIPGGLIPPCPPVVSLVTGKRSYDDMSARELLRQWIDHPQRLWDGVCATLSAGVTTIIHVGPEPNLIPATFRRLSENVGQQTTGYSWNKIGMRAVSGLARRPWLSALLPAQAALLRAPLVQQVILEDWLLENPPH
jgi:[acyl-carrier-protein] S-malonyltransferase